MPTVQLTDMHTYLIANLPNTSGPTVMQTCAPIDHTLRKALLLTAPTLVVMSHDEASAIRTFNFCMRQMHTSKHLHA